MSIIESFLFVAGTVATFIAVFALVTTDHVLTPPTAFMILAFMNVLRITLSLRLGNAIPLAFELLVSLKRIESFLLLNNMPLDPLEYNQSCSGCDGIYKPSSIHAPVLVRGPTSRREDVEQLEILPGKRNKNLSVSNLSCKLYESDERYLLQDVSFDASKSSLTVITGQVGSGKSTLLAAIAGEVIRSSGNIVCSGTIAYVSQTAWVFSGTFRENVLFGELYDEKKYADVIEACALKEDINRFSNGDLSFVGEHGVAMSGGQRARLNLARAVYADADVYLLDDPLSAVDAKVSEHIFNQCICKLLKEKIIILATYAEKHMKVADQVVVLHKGCVLGKGSFDELQDGRKILDSIKDSSQTSHKQPASGRTTDENEMDHSDPKPVIGSYNEDLEISEEDKATGSISFRLYWDYFRAGLHPVFMISVVLLFLGTQGKCVFFHQKPLEIVTFCLKRYSHYIVGAHACDMSAGFNLNRWLDLIEQLALKLHSPNAAICSFLESLFITAQAW